MGDRAEVNGVSFDDALRTCGYSPGVTLDEIEERNLERRERIFQENTK